MTKIDSLSRFRVMVGFECYKEKAIERVKFVISSKQDSSIVLKEQQFSLYCISVGLLRTSKIEGILDTP